MKRFGNYHIYLVTTIVITSVLSVSIAVAMSLKHLELIGLFLSLLVFDFGLWFRAFINKRKLKEDFDKKQEVKKQLEEVKKQVANCKLDAEKLNDTYNKIKKKR